MPDRFALDSPQHAAISGELCLEHGSHHLVSGRTVRRAMLVGGLGAGAWLAMMALGQGHAQAAPAQPLSIGQHAVTTTLGSVAKTASAVTAGVTTSPTHAAPAHVQHRSATAPVTSVVATVRTQTHPVVHVVAATVGRVGRTTAPLTTIVTHVTAPVTAPVTKTVTAVLTTARQVAAPVTTPIKTVLKPVLAPIVPRVEPIVSPVVGPILTVTAPITATVPTSITRPAFPVHTFSSATLITATATATPAATADVPIGARADVGGTGRASSSVAVNASSRRHVASTTALPQQDVVVGRGGLPSNPGPVPAPEGALAGSAASSSSHGHDRGSALVGRSARLATPASISTAWPGSDRLPGDPIRSTDVSPD